MPAQRVVERVDAQLRPLAVVVDRAAGDEDGVVLVHEHGVVDLQQEAGVDDALYSSCSASASAKTNSSSLA